MSNNSSAVGDVGPPEARHPWNRHIAIVTIVAAVVTVGTVVVLLINGPTVTPSGLVTTTVPRIAYPIGIPSATEPSGMAPPGPFALPGYSRDYVNDFTGSTVPPGWDVFAGIPGGDPGGQFGEAHVVVTHSMLELQTWKDPAYQNRWVTGGLCQCGLTHHYGAFFVRSRDTGAGPNEVMLLWPVNHPWPPEIDFNESGGSNVFTSWTLHWSAANQIVQQRILINMRQWHTWGIVWSAKSIIFTVDGNVWGTITEPFKIPGVTMRLDLEQRAECAIHQQCPAAPVSLLVDWIAEYSAI
ncbi:MAG: glycoside hydrolase family 16 protein [Acidimicrobiales bacterium]